MKILIFGASGATGQHLVKQALSKGHFVTAFVRDLAKIRLTHPNLRVIRGNINYIHDVRSALDGQDVVLSTLGASSPFRYDQSVVDGFGTIIKAMKSAGVERLIYLSTMGIGSTRRNAGFLIRYIAPVLLSTELKGHQTREKMLMDSQLRWTIVRATTLTNGRHLREYKSGAGIKSKSFAATISRADVADFMLNIIASDQYLHGTPAVMYK